MKYTKIISTIAILATISSVFLLKSEATPMAVLSEDGQKFAARFAEMVAECETSEDDSDAQEQELIMLTGTLPVKEVVTVLTSQRARTLTKGHAYRDKNACKNLSLIVKNLLPELKQATKDGHGEKLVS